MGRSTAWHLVLATFTGLMVASCVTDQAYFRPTETQARQREGDPVQTRYMVPLAANAHGLLLHAEARAFREEFGEGLSHPALQVRLWLRNSSAKTLELRLAEFTITDDEGRTFPFSRGLFQGEATSVVLARPHAARYADVFFRLPQDYDVMAPGALSLHWSLRIGSQEYLQKTRFAREAYRAFQDPFFNVPLGAIAGGTF